MNLSFKLFEIAAQTFREHVSRRGFIFFAFIVPLVCPLLFCAATLWLVPSRANTLELGLVDESEWISNSRVSQNIPSNFQVQHFGDVASADAAWRAGKIDGYFVVTRDYLQTGQVRQVSRIEVAPFARSFFEQFLRAQLLEKSPPEVRARILDGTRITHHPLNQGDALNWDRALAILLAGGLVIVFFGLNQFTQNYLWQAVHAEHENRTIEIMLTSVSLPEFFAGKVLGIALTGLTPLIVWGVVIGIGVWVGLSFLSLLGVSVGAGSGWQLVAAGLLVLAPAYLLGAMTMVLIGALTNVLEQGQPLPWFLDLIQAIVFLPLMIVALTAPDGAVAVVLSLLPWTAPIVLTLRLGLTDVALWQILVAIILEWLTLFGMLRLSARLYHAASSGNGVWRVLFGIK